MKRNKINFFTRGNLEEVARDEEDIRETLIADDLLKVSYSPGIVNILGDEKGKDATTKNIKIFFHDSIPEEDSKVIYAILRHQLQEMHLSTTYVEKLICQGALKDFVSAFSKLSCFTTNSNKNYNLLFVFPKSLEKQYAQKK